MGFNIHRKTIVCTLDREGNLRTYKDALNPFINNIDIFTYWQPIFEQLCIVYALQSSYKATVMDVTSQLSSQNEDKVNLYVDEI